MRRAILVPLVYPGGLGSRTRVTHPKPPHPRRLSRFSLRSHERRRMWSGLSSRRSAYVRFRFRRCHRAVDAAVADTCSAGGATAPLAGTVRQTPGTRTHTPVRSPRSRGEWAPTRQCSVCWRVGASGWISLVLGNIRVHEVPRLCTLDEYIGLGAELARIVEAADPQADNVGPRRDPDEQWTAALLAKRTRHRVAGVAGTDKQLGRTVGDAKSGGGHPHCRDISAAALMLAISAMAQQRKQRLSHRLVPHRSAQTAPGPHHRHHISPYRLTNSAFRNLDQLM